jgi:hypothetical protein
MRAHRLTQRGCDDGESRLVRRIVPPRHDPLKRVSHESCSTYPTELTLNQIVVSIRPYETFLLLEDLALTMKGA